MRSKSAAVVFLLTSILEAVQSEMMCEIKSLASINSIRVHYHPAKNCKGGSMVGKLRG